MPSIEFCPQCGLPVRLGATHCSACSRPVPVFTRKDPSATYVRPHRAGRFPRSRNWSRVLVFMSVVGLSVALLFGVARLGGWDGGLRTGIYQRDPRGDNSTAGITVIRCPRCSGTGQAMHRGGHPADRMPMRDIILTCPTCSGTGTITEHKAPASRPSNAIGQ